ncbi:primosomal protein N' [Sulfuriflexus sp.]|uniref:primosomal protein N' n=1 Tax=Sulfuriflexus sp. TaxID=2015443 RepID=UPI0028CE9F43|nr:primosomal protein N' [Sulfuriflexus sp.]MDT8403167.1 primosomal protein N' [Sulfuriflexus sp.]
MPVPTFLRIAVPSPLRRSFDYLPPKGVDIDTLQAGQRVRIPFGRQVQIGVILAIRHESDIEPKRLRHVLGVLDQTPVLTEELLALLQWASDYYHQPIGEMLANALPVLLRKGQPAQARAEVRWQLTASGSTASATELQRAPKQAALFTQLRHAHPLPLSAPDFAAQHTHWRPPLRALIERGWVEKRLLYGLSTSNGTVEDPLPVNSEQQAAIEAITARAGEFACFLLDGVTGSGKTEVYLGVIAEILRQGKQALVLVPEISLTPQTVARFQRRFACPIAILHSGLSDRERLDAWLAAAANEAGIVIGTRSALFTPLAQPGVIIIDEEHDTSFKQQDGVRYHARDVAILRARRLGIPIVLGSATPALESLLNVEQGRYQSLKLSVRATGAALPPIQTIDLRGQPLLHGLSKTLTDTLRAHLARGEQALLFLNRRGYAPTLCCHDCGWLADCPRCDARLTFHAGHQRLRCHHCGTEQVLMPSCPDCGSTALRALGQGTERIEEALAEMFPAVGVIRIDRDSTRRKGAMQTMLDSIHSGEKQLLVGTQMLAKGHHFPSVTLVGILDADQGLFGADFRASERMAQLIIQVAGRAGRADKPGQVLLQTYHPEHPLLRSLLTEGYAAFAAQALRERREAELPPYTAMAILRAEATDRDRPLGFLSKAYELASGLADASVELLGPLPAPMERRAGRFRAQLLLQAPQRGPLQHLLTAWLPALDELAEGRKVRWSIDVDPADTL